MSQTRQSGLSPQREISAQKISPARFIHIVFGSSFVGLFIILFLIGCEDKPMKSPVEVNSRVDVNSGTFFVERLAPGEKASFEISFSIEAPEGYRWLPNDLGGHYLKNEETGEIIDPDTGEIVEISQ